MRVINIQWMESFLQKISVISLPSSVDSVFNTWWRLYMLKLQWDKISEYLGPLDFSSARCLKFFSLFLFLLFAFFLPFSTLGPSPYYYLHSVNFTFIFHPAIIFILLIILPISFNSQNTSQFHLFRIDRKAASLTFRSQINGSITCQITPHPRISQRNWREEKRKFY